MNKTTISFTPHFKQIVKEIQEHPMAQFLNHFDGNIIHHSECQEELRNYILETYPHIIKNQMPDFYAFFICLIIKIDDYNSWEEVCEIYRDFVPDEFNDLGDTTAYISCACSKSGISSDNAFMAGLDKKLLLGCSCIEKNKIFNLGDQKRKRAKQVRQRDKKKINDEIKQYQDYTKLIKSYRYLEDEKIIKKHQDYTNLIKSYRPKRCACTKIIDPKYTQCWPCRNKNTDTCKCGKQKDKKYPLCWECNQDYHTNSIPLETHAEWRKKYLG
jgi:hypothetical protein